MVDQTKEQINLVVESDCEGSGPHYALDTVYERMATLTVQVNEWADLGTMNVSDFAVAGEAEYVLPQTFSGGSAPGCEPFDDLCGEGDFVFQDCEIDPVVGEYAAGLKQTITITGREFSDRGYIRVRNGDDGGQTTLRLNSGERYIEVWEDSKIVVNLSSLVQDNSNNTDLTAENTQPMCSGTWRVFPKGKNSLRCGVPVEIKFSAENRDIDEDEDEDRLIASSLALTSANNDGTYFYTIDDATLSLIDTDLPTFLPVVQAAANYWAGVVGINLRYSAAPPAGLIGLTTIQAKSRTADDDPNFAAVTLRAVNTNTPLCIGPNPGSTAQSHPQIYSNFRSATITLFSDLDWSVTTSSSQVPFGRTDAYSVMVHEFGHMLGLRHAAGLGANGDPTSDPVMYYTLGFLEIKRVADNNSIEGINTILCKSVEAMAADQCLRAYVLDLTSINPCDFVNSTITPAHHFEEEAILIQRGNTIPIRPGTMDIVLYDVNGKLMKRERGGLSLDTTGLGSGHYFLIQDDESGHQVVTRVVLMP